MPCSDSSSGFNLRVDPDNRFVRSEFAKITCSSPISSGTILNSYCKGKLLDEILELEFAFVVYEVGQGLDEDAKYILFLELQALQACAALYLGVDHPSLDKERCKISLIEHTEEYVDIALVILPSKDLPKIIPCGMIDKKA